VDLWIQLVLVPVLYNNKKIHSKGIQLCVSFSHQIFNVVCVHKIIFNKNRMLSKQQ
jgi:hypothetical protein